jgi:hypothetical protein
MPLTVEDQVVEFFAGLFEAIFASPLRLEIGEVKKRRAVLRQIEEAADAASQSLTRFLKNARLSSARVSKMLKHLEPLGQLLSLDDLSSTYTNPEDLAIRLAEKLAFPVPETEKRLAAIFRESLHSVVQVLLLVGPVMVEWKRLRFASTFELPRRIVDRLNQISEQLELLGRSGVAAADERFELGYRDYLLQRFFRIEAGTVRMTTNLAIDLRELFVMPQVRPGSAIGPGAESVDSPLLNLAKARERFGGLSHTEPAHDLRLRDRDGSGSALDQILEYRRNVLVGPPGSGKSTLLEWLQLRLAAADVELILDGQQAIPLMLRVRQLNPRKLPTGAALIEQATASPDRARIMPRGWIDRQMQAGRVLVMVDGLDELEASLRERRLIPWIRDLCETYPACRFLLSSRAMGYEPGTLEELGFARCELLDFDEGQISTFTQHWCTAVRLARNEPEGEARREGRAEGDRILANISRDRYILDLAQNPLMLSTICLVDYFEGGRLPGNRSLLYKLCIEGLLHYWDERRGIHSEFGLEEKLRVCREIAMSMQDDDRAEYEAKRVREVFRKVFPERRRADRLFEHIRQRTGLLVERRPEIFAFVHLTFQEYLAAQAVVEGNLRRIDMHKLLDEHEDHRWREVIPLYCGVAPAQLARIMLIELQRQAWNNKLVSILIRAVSVSHKAIREDEAFVSQLIQNIYQFWQGSSAAYEEMGSPSSAGEHLMDLLSSLSNEAK